MTGSSAVAPTGAPAVPSTHRPTGRFVLPAVSIGAAVAAVGVLATQPVETFSYGVALVPALVLWLAAGLSIVVAIVGLSARQVTSTAGAVLVGGLLVATVLSVGLLPFDALRIVGLIPLPLSAWGLALRLLLLVSGTAALVPAMRTRRAHQSSCPTCGRMLPGALDRIPRWPIAAALVASLIYPALRVAWAFGATFGTTGDHVELDPVLVGGLVATASVLVVVCVVLLVGRGPLWARALLGFGGVVAGLALTVNGGLAAVLAVDELVTDGLDSSAGSGLMTWTFLLVYASWFVAGLGVIAGSWRYWAHRRDTCPTCGPMLAA